MFATLLLGSNLGESRALLADATALLTLNAGRVVRQTTVHRSAAWGFESAHEFFNQILVVETLLAPLELLDVIEGIERSLGREKAPTNWHSVRIYADRTMDIDILYYGAQIDPSHSIDYEDERLRIPHPHISDRPFTLALLEELGR